MDEDEVIARLRAAGCVFAEEEASLLLGAGRPASELAVLVGRREAGEPLEHLLGWVDIGGVRSAVGPGVFVPRQRSRVLVEAALGVLAARPDGQRVVVELCCGAAALARTIQVRCASADVWASDIDPVAVEMARRNLPADRVVLGDLFDGLPRSLRGGVDVVVANAPYVPTDEIGLMPVEAREHEPRHALDGGSDGLALHRRIAAAAGAWLAADGVVAIETSRRQLGQTRRAFESAGLATAVRRDEEIDGTSVVGRRRRG